MTWYIGQKVLCIRTSSLRPFPAHPKWKWVDGDCKPQKTEPGKIYTIRYIWPAGVRMDDLSQGLAFWLNEMDDDFYSYHEELFVPIETRAETSNAYEMAGRS